MSRLPTRHLRTTALAAIVALLATNPAVSHSASAAAVRKYYIAADQVRWNYAPSGKNLITGQPFSADDAVYVQNGPDRIGSIYLKSLYREYTDGSFSQL